MSIWTSSVLLANLIVISSSFPNPDKLEYKIPEVGTGERSQYYVLHRDGTFKYGFDTGEGAYESVKSETEGNREGKFGYVDEDGNTIRLEYEAGEGGFVARGDHLPKPSEGLAEALAEVVRRTEAYVDPLANTDSDASYKFRFQSEAHSRTEEADSDGSVTGSYSYVDEDGVLREFTYRAGKGIGFVIEGTGLTQDVRRLPISQPRTEISQPTKSRTQPSSLSKPVSHSFKQATHYSNNKPDISSSSRRRGDASYSFSYDAGDHSRSEVSDPDLNVKGTFSFVADDGVKRTLDYEAGSNKGFLAEGDHLPRDSNSVFGRRASIQRQRTPRRQTTSQRHSSSHGTRSSQSHGSTSGQRTPRKQTTSQRHSSSLGQRTSQSHGSTAGQRTPRRQTTSQGYTSSHGQTTSLATPNRITPTQRGGISSTHRQPQQRFSPVSTTSRRQSFEQANVISSLNPGNGYSFSYKTSTHSRDESGDAENNVKGRFDFVADDEIRREINYEAGRETGFIAEGEHIPIGPSVPGAPSGQPTGRFVPVEEIPFEDPLADSDSDASYKFGFESDSYSRSETADEDGNVEGTYSVVDEDGIKVTYRFRAGRGIGFEREEISRVAGPRPPKPEPYKGPLASDFKRTSVSSQTLGHRQTTGTRDRTRQTQSVGRTDHIRSTGHTTAGHSSRTSGHTSTGYKTRTRGQTSTGHRSSGQTSTGHRSSGQTSTGHRSSGQTSTGHRSSGQTSTGHNTRSSSHPSQGSTSTRTNQIGTRSSSHATSRGTNVRSPPQVNLGSAFEPTHSQQVFPGFTLFNYAPSPTAEKFGYVLKYNK